MEEHEFKEKEQPFEELVERLERIVRTLEKGDAPLDESLLLFEEGVRLSRMCAGRLDEAEGKIEALLKRADGDAREPFALGDGADAGAEAGS